VPIGKVSFDADKLTDNANEILSTILKLKPASAKGDYMKSVYVSSTMSPSVQIESKSIA
jgi:large subunit ribosomal protein L1